MADPQPRDRGLPPAAARVGGPCRLPQQGLWGSEEGLAVRVGPFPAGCVRWWATCCEADFPKPGHLFGFPAAVTAAPPLWPPRSGERSPAPARDTLAPGRRPHKDTYSLVAPCNAVLSFLSVTHSALVCWCKTCWEREGGLEAAPGRSRSQQGSCSVPRRCSRR